MSQLFSSGGQSIGVSASTSVLPVNTQDSSPSGWTGWISLQSTLKSLGKDPDAGKDVGQKEKGTTEDKMVGWHHRLHGREFEQILGDGGGQSSLVCYSSWGRKQTQLSD